MKLLPRYFPLKLLTIAGVNVLSLSCYPNPTTAQYGGVYHYFSLHSSIHLSRWWNYDNFGRDELSPQWKPNYNVGVGYGIDIHNRHHLEIGMLYTRQHHHFHTTKGIHPEQYYSLQKYSIAIPLWYTFVLTTPSKTYRKDLQYGLGLGWIYQRDLHIQEEYFIDPTSVSPITFFNYNNPPFQDFYYQHSGLRPTHLWSNTQLYLSVHSNIRYFFLDYTAVEGSIYSYVSLLDPRLSYWQTNLSGKKYAKPHIGGIGLAVRIIQYLPYW